MQRAIWTGSISFGLLNVPVKIYTGATPKSVKFNQLNQLTGNRIKQKKVDSVTGDEVNLEDIVKGYALTPERYVTVNADELEAVKPQNQGKAISLERFVPVAQIDPGFYDSSYNIGPDLTSVKGYRMLVQAMDTDGMAAIGRVVLREKERVVALRSKDGVLVMSTLIYADEINPASEIPNTDVESQDPSDKEVELASSLIEALSGDFVHGDYVDSYRMRVMDLIGRKSLGEEIDTTIAAPAIPAPDLMSALEASLASVKGSKPKPAPKKKPTPRKPAAKKTKVTA
jgi:DNA end-binding protein Ku